MKKLILIASLLGAVAWAASSASKVTTVSLANITTEPTSATAGLPTEFAGAGTQELRRLIVTAKQPDDAGSESQDLTRFQGRAWKYTLQGTLADAGTLFRWSRMPELDVNYTWDGGSVATDYTQLNNGITVSVVVPPMGNNSRITYTAQSLTILDGGTGNVDLIIEGRYLDPMHP